MCKDFMSPLFSLMTDEIDESSIKASSQKNTLGYREDRQIGCGPKLKVFS
jgi:hypothetical protein